MGFFDNVKSGLENAKATVQSAQQDYNSSKVSPYLLQGENVIYTKSVKEDFICLTEKRLVFVNANLLSSKKGITSIPYNKITGVSLEKGGMMSFSKNVIVWVGSKDIVIDTWSTEAALELFRLLSEKTL
ncbi:PH domain-containing protein [Chryseobacterium sp. NEB161]|nr:PH domain-containing protein [Chryseobacterium sp. NEB161]